MMGRSVGYSLLLACITAVAVRAGDGPMALPLPEPSPAANPADSSITPSVGAQPPGPRLSLGLQELKRTALSKNPTVAQAIDRFEQARGRAVQAGAYPNPLIVWSATSLGDQGTVGQQQGFFQQPIVTGGKLRVNRTRYEVDVESSRWLVYQERLLVRNGVRMRYLQILAQHQPRRPS